jgi:hypothetical protein
MPLKAQDRPALHSRKRTSPTTHRPTPPTGPQTPNRMDPLPPGFLIAAERYAMVFACPNDATTMILTNDAGLPTPQRRLVTIRFCSTFHVMLVLRLIVKRLERTTPTGCSPTI